MQRWDIGTDDKQLAMYLYRSNLMMVHGNTVIVYSHEEFERLLVLPASLSGWFDPARAIGVVKFPHAGRSGGCKV